jgi:ketosteroid isomerase-like protein
LIIFDSFANCLTVVSLRRYVFAWLVLLSAISRSSIGMAQESPIHDELRKVRDELFAAYEARDIDALLQRVHPEVVATWQNSFRARGHSEVRKFIDDMLSGKQPVVKDVKSTLTVDGLSVLHGDTTAVACGDILDQFSLTSGSAFELNSKWTASMVKSDGRWQVASFHVSSNIFDNPILGMAQSWLVTVAAIVGVISLMVGLIVGRTLLRPKLT